MGMKVKKILVTGGAGFIGSHLVDELLRRGLKVVVLDNFFNGDLNNLRPHLEDPNFELIEGDVRDRPCLKRAIEDVDAVIHEAAITSVPLSVKNPKLTFEVNSAGTLNLLEASAGAGVRRFVFASSCAVYGEAKKVPISEEEPPMPLSPYAKSKLDAEGHCLKFYNERGLETVILRYFNVYGPRQASGEYAGVMMKFLDRLSRGLPPVIYGDGEQTRDFVYVSDAVEATLLALNCKRCPGEVFNIGSGREVSINRLCDIFQREMNRRDLKPVYRSARKGDIRRSRADISKAERILGYRPKVSIETGIKRLIGHFFGRPRKSSEIKAIP